MSAACRAVAGGCRALVVLCLMAAPAVQAAREAVAADEDTANCVAVMQTNADELARRIKAGERNQEPALRNELERAAALIGRTYLDGFHDGDEAKARLKAAQDAQAKWDDARKVRVRAACLKRADAELASASGAERFIVQHVAQRRLKRMLSTH